jgi:hypothetical protein
MHVPTFLWWIAGLLLLRVLARPILALAFGKQLGAAVAARIPDTVTLQPAGPTAAKECVAIEADAMALMQYGFSDAGWFTMSGMPGVAVRLLACEAEGWLGMLYEHPKAGRWAEFGMRFPDGSRASFSSARATGLSGLANVHSVHMAGAPVSSLLAAARKWAAKAGQTPLPLNAAQAPTVFEEGYAWFVAQRKAKGISRSDVANVAIRPKLSIKIDKDAA